MDHKILFNLFIFINCLFINLVNCNITIGKNETQTSPINYIQGPQTESETKTVLIISLCIGSFVLILLFICIYRYCKKWTNKNNHV